MGDAASFIDAKRNNRRASFVILAGVFALLFIVTNVIIGVFGAYTSEKCAMPVRDSFGRISQDCQSSFHFNAIAFAFTIALVAAYLLIAWLFSGSAALTMAKARPADGPEFADLRNVVEQMAIAAGIPVPLVYVIDDPAPNAFATGRNPKHAAITVTTGLLATMSTRELRGVIAHETAHILNRDIAVTTLAVLAVGAIAVIAQVGIRVGFFSGGRRNDAAGAMLIIGIVLYVIAVPRACCSGPRCHESVSPWPMRRRSSSHESPPGSGRHSRNSKPIPLSLGTHRPPPPTSGSSHLLSAVARRVSKEHSAE